MTAPRTESLRRVESEVRVMLRRIRRMLVERAHAVHPDLNTASYLLLVHVVEHGPMRAAALAEEFQVDKGAVSRQVQGLTELGLVERTQDPDDGRAWLISATAPTVARVQEIATARREVFDERLSDWPAADLAAFADGLGRYNTALGG